MAPVQALAWEPPYASGAALKSKKKKERKELLCINPYNLYSSVISAIC